MNPTMKKFIILFLFAALWGSISFSQIYQFDNPKQKGHETALKNTGTVTKLSTDQIRKKPGHYTTGEWRALIDSFWGPGVPTATKLALFDDFWNAVDQEWGGFPNLYVNWDSLRSVYRPIVEAGVSRGRLAGILSRLSRALQEPHAGVIDRGIDSTLECYPWKENEYPNLQSFHYSPGIPVINMLMTLTNFGAGLTLLPDSSILVYSVMSNHPLGLQPGDLILGYDGIPWKKELNDLFEAELPLLMTTGTLLGSSTAAAGNAAMTCVGLNWGLFDTIDVVKYPTNDTMHYPTSLLAAITPPYYVATEQLPVKGVPFPDIRGNKMVSWGIVEGTTIGYIYAWDWAGVPDGQTRILFGQAVNELMHINNVSGLILDFRTNHGGNPSYANDGFKQLLNIDPTYNYSAAKRVIGDDHYAFTINPAAPYGEHFTPTTELFEYPMAVLLGPHCGSGGDYNAFRLRFHPMTRFFGQSTNGAYTVGNVDYPNSYIFRDPFEWRIDGGCIYSNVNNEGYMIHKSFPVDEEVWLTRDGVAKGEDDVVNRALEWINNLSYAHSVTLDKTFLRLNTDTSVIISAIVENPNNHMLSVYAKITDRDKVPVDSVNLFDDGGHSDANPGDGIWSARWPMPSVEKTYAVNITTEDTTAGSLRTLPNVVHFTSIGPVVFEGIIFTGSDTIPNSGDNLYFKVTLKNNGLTASAVNIKAELISLDTMALIPSGNNNRSFAEIAPGELSTTKSEYKIAISKNFPTNKEIPVKVDITSDDFTFWSDTFSILVREPVNIEEISEPLTRIYPNPTENILNIELHNADNQPLEIEIFTVTGEVIYQKDYKNIAAHFVEQVDLSGCAKGIYLVKVKQDRNVVVGKVVVR
jgi:hypothetical protein